MISRDECDRDRWFRAMRACEMHDYMYNIIRPDDIVVPPKNDLFQKDKMA